TGVAVDAAGNIFINDWYNYRIREIVKATGNIITIAGNGTSTTSGDGGPATSAGFANPWALAVDANDNVFIADPNNNRIRELVQATGTIITVAGNGSFGYTGDGGPATAATLGSSYGVSVDSSGNLFYADYSYNVVREVLANSSPVLGALTATTWTANQPGFSGSITVSGGTGPYSGLTATGLPAGLAASLSGSTITVSGTPTSAG